MFNKDLLTWCKGPKFKEQHIDLVLLPDMINKKEEYRDENDQWMAETGLQHAQETIQDYWTKLLRWNL